MKLFLQRFLMALTGLMAAFMVSAQDLPVLPQDPAIRNGVLPNGMHYYIAENPSIRGVADFALVQKTGTQNVQDTLASRAVSVARESLSRLPRFKGNTLQSFFSSHGAVPDRNGFVKVYEDATAFTFKDIAISAPETVDSVLLALMDIVDRVSTTEDPFIRKWYSPSDQALIVAGDINPSDVEYKLKMLSMMTPASASHQRKDYVWEPTDSPIFFQVEDTFRDLAVVSVSWRSSRPPVELMNTVQPVIYQMFLMQLGKVAKERISSALRAENIAYADVSARYRMGIQSHGDESFTVEVSVADENLPEAVRIISSVMSSIDAGLTGQVELARIKQECIDDLGVSNLLTVRDNSAYVEQCTTAFLYNGDLATPASKIGFISSRELSDETELRIFNSIASALLDPSRNLSVGYYGSMHPDSLGVIFREAWEEEPDTLEARPLEYLPEYVPSAEKIKVRSEKYDPMSKGIAWTFSNGLKVVYKKQDTDGRMFFDLALNEGFGSIEDLEKEEGGYIGDYLFLSEICGIKGQDFLNMLSSEGVRMDSYVGLSNMMLSGYAPRDRMHLMLRALLAVLNEREPDADAAEYYARCMALRHEYIKGSHEEKVIEINRIMCPDYKYLSCRGLSELPEDLMYKADRYFRNQSAKINDGVLLLVGDMDEAQLKKILLTYAGGFRMTDKAFKRPSVKYSPASGWSTYTVEGSDNSVDVAISMPLALSAENFLAAEMASLLLKRHLSKALTNAGVYMEMSHDCRIYPQERYMVMISLSEAHHDGFSSDTNETGHMEALAVLRSALSSLPEMEVTDEEIKALKAQMKSAVALQMKDPYYWLNVISRRYLAGKDFTTNIDAKIDALSVSRVRSILTSLDKGSKVEYITSIK